MPNLKLWLEVRIKHLIFYLKLHLICLAETHADLERCMRFQENLGMGLNPCSGAFQGHHNAAEKLDQHGHSSHLVTSGNALGYLFSLTGAMGSFGGVHCL